MRLPVLTLLSLAACGAPKAPAPAAAPSNGAAPAATADAPSPPADPDAPLPVPSECADASSDVCTPPSNFVQRLCAKPNQNVALALFAKATPFTRLYLKGKVDELLFDEEVLALRRHTQPKGGIQVGSGAGSYEVLRWDGSCSQAVEAEMVTKTRPAKPKTARVQWSRIDENAQNALIAGSDAVKKAHAARGKECKGAMMGDVTAACERADAQLVDGVVQYLRGGGALPTTTL